MKIKPFVFISIVVTYFLLLGCNNSNNKDTASILGETEKFNSVELADSNFANLDNNKLQEIIQKSIDLSKLQQYFHIKEKPDRSPLIILKSGKIPSILELNKFGKQVKILDKSSIEKQNKAYLIFSKISIRQNTASVQFNYPVEGISVRIEFIKKDNKWLIKESELIEN